MKKAIFFAFTLTACCTLSVATIEVRAEEYIRIASFNIAEFGEGTHPATRDLSSMADMLVDNSLDLIAIQEVGVRVQAVDQVDALVTAMNGITTGDPTYFAFVTPQSGDERCAFIYRSPVVLGDEILWLDEDKNPEDPGDGGKTYYRIPVAVAFTADEFDFYIVNVHLTWGKLTRREKEIKNLKRFLKDDSDPEEDWIVLGDMNRYGKYKKSDKKAESIPFLVETIHGHPTSCDDSLPPFICLNVQFFQDCLPQGRQVAIATQSTKPRLYIQQG